MDVPIVQAPIGSACTPELAAAVSNAGGLGTLALTWTTQAVALERIHRTQELTRRRFGVNLCLAFPIRKQLAVALAAEVPIISTFWGDPSEVHEQISEAGALHLHTVSSAAEARAAVDVGVDVIVAQGWESGGHVRGQVATMALVPAVVDVVGLTPVIAAGGIGDGRGLVAAMALGAQAVWLGTRFLTAYEADTHSSYRTRVIEARGEEAVLTTCFDGGWPEAPHRVLSNEVLRTWEAAGRPLPPTRPGDGTVVARGPEGIEYRLYDDMPPLASFTGAVDDMACYAGQSVGVVHDAAPAAAIIEQIMDQARSALAGIPTL